MRKKIFLVLILSMVCSSMLIGYLIGNAQADINHPKKAVQSYIQGLLEAVDLLELADIKLQAYKAAFVSRNPNLDNTNVTQQQIDALASWISDIHDAATSNVVTTLKNKDHPSHGTGSL